MSISGETKPLVLSLFPGLDLFGKAFELEGFTVVRGPDILWGGDIRDFHPPPGVFDGVIGGPPCQVFSTASRLKGTRKVDLIPEFVRVVREADPRWLVMENVPQVIGHPDILPGWHVTVLRDWDCGGLTARRRAFFSWPFSIVSPTRCAGRPSPSVMATTSRRGMVDSMKRVFLSGTLPIKEYERLQGAEGITAALDDIDASRRSLIALLGNGVPLAMGRYVACQVREALAITCTERIAA